MMRRTTTGRKVRIRASPISQTTPTSTRSGIESRRTQLSTISSCSRCRPKILNYTSKSSKTLSGSFRCCPEPVVAASPQFLRQLPSSNLSLEPFKSQTRKWKRSSAFKAWDSRRTSAHRPTSPAARTRTQQRTSCLSRPSRTTKMRRASQCSSHCSPRSSNSNPSRTSRAINLMTAPQVTTTMMRVVIIKMEKVATMTGPPLIDSVSTQKWRVHATEKESTGECGE